MKTLDELENGEVKEKEEAAQPIKIYVGMATCGIVAGARPVMTSFANEIRTRGIKNVELAIMGCIGMCKLEPIVELVDQNGTKTTYINMTAEKAARVIDEHVIEGRICADLTVNEE